MNYLVCGAIGEMLLDSGLVLKKFDFSTPEYSSCFVKSVFNIELVLFKKMESFTVSLLKDKSFFSILESSILKLKWPSPVPLSCSFLNGEDFWNYFLLFLLDFLDLLEFLDLLLCLEWPDLTLILCELRFTEAL